MSTSRQANDRWHVAPSVLGRVLPVMLPKITEYLAAALSGANSPQPDWSDLEWRIARAVAAIHGISPLLSQRLRWTGPPGWRTFLEGQRGHTARRYWRMASLLAKIDHLAAQMDIAFVPLKGEALHAIGLYAAGERPMADIDLLVKRHDLVPMSRAIMQLGYHPLSIAADEHVLAPVDRPAPSRLGEHADNGITIELHTKIGRPMPVRTVDITAQVWPLTPRPGRNDYSSFAALMRHLLIHAAVDMQGRMLRMLQLHDIALLAPRLSSADWTEVLTPGDGHADSWWAMPPLQLTAHYYPGVIPAAAIDSAKSCCPALLRLMSPRFRLSSVSASNLRGSVFPALTWVRSLPEAVNCVSHRLHGGIKAVRGEPPIKEATALQPWITRSHRRRLLEVLLGRPRPATLTVVFAALEREPGSAPEQAQPKVA
jgi:Uncharacterised nucleotidyltransferase